MPRWLSKTLELLVIPLVIGLVGIYRPFFSDGPKVTIRYGSEDTYHNLPASTRPFLDILYGVRARARKDNVKIQKTTEGRWQMPEGFEGLPQVIPNRSNADIFHDLASSFADVADDSPPEVIHLKLVNSGSRPAKDIVITPDEAGYYEVWPFGRPTEPELQGYTTTSITVPSLQPHEQKTVSFWPDERITNDPPISASHGDGNAIVESDAVYRTTDNYIIQLPKLWLTASATVLVAVLIALVFRRIFSNDHANALRKRGPNRRQPAP